LTSTRFTDSVSSTASFVPKHTIEGLAGNAVKFDSNDVLWTYERIDTYDTITECKQFIEGYINESVTQSILLAQKEKNTT